MKTILYNIFYCQNDTIKGYKNIYLDTNIGLLELSITSIFPSEVNTKLMDKLPYVEELKKKYGLIYIEEIRKSFDNDKYILLSTNTILAIEYVPNSDLLHSTQEFIIIENIRSSNISTLNNFLELKVLKIPGK